MKKRRDLDALVNGKLGGRRKKNGQHELLRNTDSSDIEEFAIPPQNLARKHRSTSRFCSTCLAVCGFFLLTACAVAVAGLVWVHIELKKDVDSLQIRLSTVENGNAGNTNEFQDVHTKIQEFSNEIQEIKIRAQSFEKNFTAVWNKINQLSSQRATQTANPEIAEMKKTVASLGSELETLKGSTRQEFDNIQKSLSANEHVTPQMEQRSFPDLISVKTELFEIQQNMSMLNVSLLQSIAYLRRDRELVTSQMNTTLVKLEDRLSILELKPITEPTMDRNMIQDTIHEAVHDALLSATDPEKNLQDLETLVNNITQELDGVKLANKLLNTSVMSSQQQLAKLDKKVEEHDTRLVTLENLQTLNNSPSDGGLNSPSPSSPSASAEKKSESPVNTLLTEPPSQNVKPTPVPDEKDGVTSNEVPIPPGGESDKQILSEPDNDYSEKKDDGDEQKDSGDSQSDNQYEYNNDQTDRNYEDNGKVPNDAKDNSANDNYDSSDYNKYEPKDEDFGTEDHNTNY